MTLYLVNFSIISKKSILFQISLCITGSLLENLQHGSQDLLDVDILPGWRMSNKGAEDLCQLRKS